MKLSLIVSVYINSCIFIYIETASAEESKFNYIYIKFVTPEVTLSCLYLPVTSSRMFVLMLLQNHHPKFGSFRFSKIKPIRKKKNLFICLFYFIYFFFFFLPYFRRFLYYSSLNRQVKLPWECGFGETCTSTLFRRENPKLKQNKIERKLMVSSSERGG